MTDKSFRIAEDEEKKGRCSREYDLLIGPGQFDCCLTEPEDRTWYRDLADVVDVLNSLYGALKAQADWDVAHGSCTEDECVMYEEHDTDCATEYHKFVALRDAALAKARGE